MLNRCVWEHNGGDTLLWSVDFPGAYARGESLDDALQKLPREIERYTLWAYGKAETPDKPTIVQEKISELTISDADSDVIFDAERKPLTMEEYERLKSLVLKSAADFMTLYESVPDKDKSALPIRKSFYGDVPRTAREMYEHTKSVNEYYFAEIGVTADNEGTILECRERGFALLEQKPGFLSGEVFDGSYGEEWSVRKVLRRFIWHDRIHAKAMCRMSERTFGAAADPFRFRAL